MMKTTGSMSTTSYHRTKSLLRMIRTDTSSSEMQYSVVPRKIFSKVRKLRGSAVFLLTIE